MMAELSSYIGDHLANRAISVCYLAPYRKSLLTSGLNHNQKQGQFWGGSVCFLFVLFCFVLALDFSNKYHTFVLGAFKTLRGTAVYK